MKLPFVKTDSRLETVSGRFNMVGEKALSDAVNLVCTEHCHTRKARRSVMHLSRTFNQIITCENRLFFRYGNLVKEVIRLESGELVENGMAYPLADLPKSVDRNLITYNGKMYAFPDKIQMGEDVWLPFAGNNVLASVLNFVNARTLVFPVSPQVENFCDDATLLKAGVVLRFSWAPDKVFTVNTVEEYVSKDEIELDDALGGIRITLDADVPQYSALPSNATAEYLDPQNRLILTPLKFGYNHSIAFSGNRILINSGMEPYQITYNDFFKIGQTIKINGSTEEKNNLTARLVDIGEDYLEFDCNFIPIKEKEHSIITLTPEIPDFTYTLMKDDRLFGVDDVKNRLYISAEKNPFLFYEGGTSAREPWSVELNETPTGMIRWMDNVLCFTENGGFRILGYNANNFRTRYLAVSGIKKGMESSLCTVGNTVYYCSDKGLMQYLGGNNIEKSEFDLPISNVKKALSDGFFAYMLVDDRIWVLDASGKSFWSENGENISHMFIFGGKRYLASETEVYLVEEQTDSTVDWSFCLHSLPYDKPKKVLPLYFTVNHSKNTDCTLKLYCKPSSKEDWKDCGSYKIKGEGNIKIPLTKSYCDDFKIKVEGSGNFTPEKWFAVYRSV